MKQISVNNGLSFTSPEDAIEMVGMEVIVNMMDDDICETVHHDLAPCTDFEFLVRYLELAENDIIIG